MATRATIRVVKREEGVSFSEKTDNYHTQIYHHYDGYPEGLGVTLASYLSDISVVTGLSGSSLQANGLGCLAAQLVCRLKMDNGDIRAGNVYIDPPNVERSWIDYEYYVWAAENKSVWISIFDGEECLFVGEPDGLLEKYSQTKYED